MSYSSHQPQAYHCRSPHSLREKDMRHIFAALSEETVGPADIFAHRVVGLLGPVSEASARAVSKRLSTALLASHKSVLDRESKALAGLDPAPADAFHGGPGSKVPPTSAEERLERLLSRRGRRSWAREMRAESGGLLFADALFPAMLRRIPEGQIRPALDGLLMMAAVANDSHAVDVALMLGADPLRACPGDGSGSSLGTHNALGAALSRHADRPLQHKNTDFSDPRCVSSTGDEMLLRAAMLIVASTPPESIPQLLTLAPLGEKPKGPKSDRLDALGLSLRLWLVHCANAFVELTPDAERSLSLLRAATPLPAAAQTGHRRDESTERERAVLALRARIEADAIAMAAGPAADLDPAMRSRPRI